MKNGEKYKDFLTNVIRFGVDEYTNEPHDCKNMNCEHCRFRFIEKPCVKFRKEWIESEEECVDDIWSDFRDLKRGDLIFINKGPVWSPYIFVEFEDKFIVYTRCIDNDGEFQLLLKEQDPRWVMKPDRFAKIWRNN